MGGGRGLKDGGGHDQKYGKNDKIRKTNRRPMGEEVYTYVSFLGPGDPLPFFSTSIVGTTLVGVLGVAVEVCSDGLPPLAFDLEARTLSSLLMNVSMSSFVMPMAAAAVK